MAASADSVTLPIPAGTVEGDLMIVAVAISYIDGPDAPHLILPVMVPPTGWTEVLADYPEGTLNWGDPVAEGNEEIRLGVWRRVAGAAEPADYTFDWSLGGSLTPYAAAIKTFVGANNTVPSIDVAAAAVLPSAVAVANPVDVDSPSVTTTVAATQLLTFFVARNGTIPAPGGTAFTVPSGQIDLTPAINLQTSGGGTQPFGMAMFIELLAAAGATGTRTSGVDVNVDGIPGLNPLQGMGYALAIAGCGGTIPRGGDVGPG